MPHQWRRPRRRDAKQRHTAKRVWKRLREEHGAEVSERQVRRYVRARRRELGEPAEAFVPRVHRAAAETEVDFGEDAGGPTGVPDRRSLEIAVPALT